MLSRISHGPLEKCGPWMWPCSRNILQVVCCTLTRVLYKIAYLEYMDRSSLVAQQFEDLVLSLLRLWLQLWCGFHPWLGKFHMPWVKPPPPPKKIECMDRFFLFRDWTWATAATYAGSFNPLCWAGNQATAVRFLTHCAMAAMLIWLYFFPLFLGHLKTYGVPGPGIRSELQLRPKLQLQQCRILNPLCWAGDWTCVPVLPRWCQSCCATTRAPTWSIFVMNKEQQ